MPQKDQFLLDWIKLYGSRASLLLFISRYFCENYEPKIFSFLDKKIDKLSLTSWKESAMQIRDSEREKKKTLLTRDQKDLKF